MRSPWIAVGCMAVVIGALTAAVAVGVRYNATESMPRGFWLEKPVIQPLQRGDTVAVCLPVTEMNRHYIGEGNCPSGLEPILKTIGAIADDTVELSADGARVNGVLLLNTAPLLRDSSGRDLMAWPFGTYLVKEGDVFLFSTYTAKSYDSRYFGPVSTIAVIARGVPILVWK